MLKRSVLELIYDDLDVLFTHGNLCKEDGNVMCASACNNIFNWQVMPSRTTFRQF